MLEWRKVEGFDYEVSNSGQVRNSRTGKVLSNRGIAYSQVTLCNKSKQVTRSVHRLVAEAFLPNPLNLPVVNHKDEDKLNNNVDNLEWCTSEHNASYSFGKPVLQLLNGKVTAEFKSASAAARSIGTRPSAILSCCNNEPCRHTHRGFEWSFKEV